MNSNNIEWNETIKKEARGINDEDLGEVQQVQGNYVTSTKRNNQQRKILYSKRSSRKL